MTFFWILFARDVGTSCEIGAFVGSSSSVVEECNRRRWPARRPAERLHSLVNVNEEEDGVECTTNIVNGRQRSAYY